MNAEQSNLNITGRNIDITEAIRDYINKKIQAFHFDYPRIIEIKVLLEVNNYRHSCEMILFCTNHITIEANSTTEDLYASIDETIDKITRRMRKHKTRLLKSHRPNKKARFASEEIYRGDIFAQIGVPESKTETKTSKVKVESKDEEITPYIVHDESAVIPPMFPDEAIMSLELNEKPFMLFENIKNHHTSLVYRRKDNDYGLINFGKHID